MCLPLMIPLKRFLICMLLALCLKTYLNSYLVTSFMQSDLDKAIKIQPITDDQVQLLIYQILRGLKVHYLKHKANYILL